MKITILRKMLLALPFVALANSMDNTNEDAVQLPATIAECLNENAAHTAFENMHKNILANRQAIANLRLTPDQLENCRMAIRSGLNYALMSASTYGDFRQFEMEIYYISRATITPPSEPLSLELLAGLQLTRNYRQLGANKMNPSREYQYIADQEKAKQEAFEKLAKAISDQEIESE